MPPVTLGELVARKKLLILTAVQIEAKAVARALGLRRTDRLSWASNGDKGLPISMYMIGMGARGLPPIDPDKVRVVLMAGLAGGLSPSLQIGDLVIDNRSTFPTDINAVRGEIHTSNTLVATPADKAACLEKSGAVAVDMENQIVREWAARMNVPFMGIRAISDRAGQSLDPSIIDAIDEFGGIKPIPLVSGLLARPIRIASLVRIGRHARLATKRLAMAVAQIVAAIDCLA